MREGVLGRHSRRPVAKHRRDAGRPDCRQRLCSCRAVSRALGHAQCQPNSRPQPCTAAGSAPAIPTKTGLMVGLGETTDEVVEVLGDLRRVDCQILTVGQYLRPSPAHLPMERYYTPEEFREFKRIALDFGFRHVESGPLVRSSYHAHEQTQSYIEGLRD